MTFQTLPPNYSEGHRELRIKLIDQLQELQKLYQAEADPIIKMLVQIESLYPPRMMYFPDGEPTPPHIEQLIKDLKIP